MRRGDDFNATASAFPGQTIFASESVMKHAFPCLLATATWGSDGAWGRTCCAASRFEEHGPCPVGKQAGADFKPRLYKNLSFSPSTLRSDPTTSLQLLFIACRDGL
jgi:hypothetical protein